MKPAIAETRQCFHLTVIHCGHARLLQPTSAPWTKATKLLLLLDIPFLFSFFFFSDVGSQFGISIRKMKLNFWTRGRSYDDTSRSIFEYISICVDDDVSSMLRKKQKKNKTENKFRSLGRLVNRLRDHIQTKKIPNFSQWPFKIRTRRRCL